MSSFQMRRLRPRGMQDSLGATRLGWAESGSGSGFSQPSTPPTPTVVSPSAPGGLGQEYLDKLTGPFWTWSPEPIKFQMACVFWGYERCPCHRWARGLIVSAGRTTSLEFFLRQTSGAEAAEAGTGRGIEPWNLRILSWPTYEEKLRPRVG